VITQEHSVGRKSDVWSFGCTVLHLVSGQLPWSEVLREIDVPQALFYKIGTAQTPPQWPRDRVSPELDSMLETCLARDPSVRPTAAELAQHPWFRITPKSQGAHPTPAPPSSKHGDISGKLKLTDKIGGRVYRAFHEETGEQIAVKIFQGRTNITGGMEVLGRLRHPHIVRYISIWIASGSLYVALELHPTSLLGVVSQCGGRIPEKTCIVYAAQVLSAVSYLHSKGIIHRSIKPTNILISAAGDTRLSDFEGMQRTSGGDTMADGDPGGGISGTPAYIAPEVILGSHVGRRCDVWSFGCTVLHIATGIMPWNEVKVDSPHALLFTIGKDGMFPYWDKSAFSSSFNDFLETCFQRDPTRRRTAKDLEGHSWIQQRA